MNNYKKLEWLPVTLISMVTCGIYSLITFYKVGEDVNAEAERLGCKKIMGFLPAFLLGMVTCGIFNIVWMFQYNKLLAEIAEKKGIELAPTKEPIVLTLILFVPIYSYYVLCDNYNRVIAEQP